MVTVIYKRLRILLSSDQHLHPLSPYSHCINDRPVCCSWTLYLGGTAVPFRPPWPAMFLFSRWLLHYLPLFLQVFGDRLLP